DLHQFGIGVGALEVRPDGGGVLTHLGVPHVTGAAVRDLGTGPVVHGLGGRRRPVDLVQSGHLGEAGSVHIDLSEVLARFVGTGVDDPVSGHFLGEGVEGAEQAGGDLGAPDIAGLVFPAAHAFRPLDHHAFTRGRRVGDAAGVAATTTQRAYPFAVLHFIHDHL